MKLSVVLRAACILVPVHGWIFSAFKQQNYCKVTKWSKWTTCDGDCSRKRPSYRWREVATPRRPTLFSRCKEPKLFEVKLCPIIYCPSECLWETWAAWTECDPCQGGRKSRRRRVMRPAMFGGQICKGSEFSIASCDISVDCQRVEVDCEKLGMYQCKITGECIEWYLVCNGDYDCKDRTDERKCDANTTMSVCAGQKYAELPHFYIAGSGYDILQDSVNGQALNNQQFGGICDTVFIPELDKIYRKPYNLQAYRSYAKTHTTLNSYVYKDTVSMSNRKVKEFEYKVVSRPSLVSFPDSGSNAARTNDKLWKKIVDSNSEGDYSYLKLESKIEVASFKMRRGDLKLTRYFKERIKKLPRTYDAAIYAHFITDFGTHYITEGKLGGVYEVIYQVTSNKQVNTQSDNYKSSPCFAFDYFKEFLESLNSTACQKYENGNLVIDTVTREASDSIAVVHGGYSSVAAQLTYAGKDAIKSVYKEWADSVPRSPMIFDFKISPISELVQDFLIRQHVDRALQDLYAKFDPKLCSRGQCLNGGEFVVVNDGRECKCICKSPFYGKACEKQSRIN